jgi:hypothetical protein
MTHGLIKVRIFPREVQTYFDRNIYAKGYYTVQFTVENNSDYTLTLQNENISLPTASPDMIAALLHTSTGGRSAAYGAAGFILFAPLLIPAVVDGIKSSEANGLVDADIHDRAAAYRNIAPRQSREHIVFVNRHSFNGGDVELRLSVHENAATKFLDFKLVL